MPCEYVTGDDKYNESLHVLPEAEVSMVSRAPRNQEILCWIS